MNRIRLRTKIEVVIVLNFLIMVAIVSVTSLTRTITDSGDTIETMIRNTKGNIWDPTSGNLQAAINDIGSQGGTIWIGSSITLSSEIKIENSINNIVIDFQGNFVTLSSSTTSFINLTNASHVTVRNLIIKPHEDSTVSIIKLYIGSSGGSTSYNTFSNIHYKNQGSYDLSQWGLRKWSQHNFTLIEMKLNGPGEINENTFIRITAEGPDRGMYFNQPVNAGWINGTYVDSVYLDQYRECIRFNHYTGNRSFNYNRFCNIKTQTCVFTEYGIIDISGFGNHFDHILMWDWYACGPAYSNTGIREYSITSDADSTYMQLHAYSELASGGVTNNGKNTMVISLGKIKIGG